MARTQADLVLNTNTYVTLEDADAYVESNFLSQSPEYKAWFDETRPESDKVVALLSSAKALNNLRYKGRKLVRGQSLAFPRSFNTFPGVIYTPYVSQFTDNSLIEGVGGSNGLDSAKEAQVVNAVYHLSLNPALAQEVSDRAISGILGRRAGSVSENYASTNERGDNMLRGIYNQDRVYYILNAWLTDSVFSL